MMDQRNQIRVAIVGSGMAGLVTAYLLHQDEKKRYAVTVFEEKREFSLDSASISVPNSSTGRLDRVDLPMRAFAGGYYRSLTALYDHLNVEYHSQSFLYSFSKLETSRHQATPYFIHSSNNHRMPPLKPEPQALYLYVLEMLYLMVLYFYFTLCCIFIRPHLARPGRPCESLDEYLSRIRIPRYFTTRYILPLISSVTTCPHAILLQFPACDVTEYKRRTNGAQHYTLANGVGDVQERLAKGIDIRISADVLSVRPQSSGEVRLQWRHTEDRHGLTLSTEQFDSVILAVPPDVVGKIFEPLRNAMARIPTLLVESIVHTDNSAIQGQLSSIKENIDGSQSIFIRTSISEGRTESIHVQPSGVLVTTCPFSSISTDQIIRRSRFTRVLRTPESREIVNGILGERSNETEKSPSNWRNGDGGVWLVGGWCWDGMVLLEGCAVSAFRTASAFGIELSKKE